MKHLLILVIILFALIPAQVHGLNYLTLMKAYSEQDILDNFNLCDVTFNGKVVEVIGRSNEKIILEFDNSFDYQEKNNLKRILYTNLTASYAKALYDYYNFGKPSGGFEE